MKKNYVYLTILLVVTVLLTIVLASIYKSEVSEESFLYEKINKISSNEFSEYLMENPETIIYISTRLNSEFNKFEKRFFKKLEKLNLTDKIIYLETYEIDETVEKSLKENFDYKYDSQKIPSMIIVSDGVATQIVEVKNTSDVNSIINYEVFE